MQYGLKYKKVLAAMNSSAAAVDIVYRIGCDVTMYEIAVRMMIPTKLAVSIGNKIGLHAHNVIEEMHKCQHLYL